jgi:glucosamine 6-phosphate synthetase-like amidotransferase/phosphosugar isomerase protein
MQITKARLEDMAKITDQEQAVALMSQNIQKDLQTIPQELKNISKKQVALQMSKQVQDEAKDLKNLSNNSLNKNINNLNQNIDEFQDKVFAFIFSTEEEINQCPTSLQDKLANLQKYFTENIQIVAQWSPDEITKIRTFLADISNDIKVGNCLEAMEKIESINQILQIHSLDIKVETSTPEN